MTLEEKYVLDTTAGLLTLKLFIRNGNMGVGKVTVRHMIFSDICAKIKNGDPGVMKDAEVVFGFCFGNYNTVASGKGGSYVSPYNRYRSKNGFVCIKVSPRTVNKVYERCKRMQLTEQNIFFACSDLAAAGRMFQELTIDATKTMYKVEIPYGENMKHVSLMSRANGSDDLNVVCDWKYHSLTGTEQEVERRREIKEANGGGVAWQRKTTCSGVKYVVDKRRSCTVKKNVGGVIIPVRIVRDYLHELRIDAVNLGIEYFEELMKQEQLWSDAILDAKNNLLKNKARIAREIAEFLHDTFRSVTSYQTAALAALETAYEDDPGALSEFSKDVKRQARKGYNAISNMLRAELEKLGLNDDEKILILLDIVMSEGNNSSYAHTILGEEFFRYVFKCYGWDRDISKVTEEKLLYCDIPAGETVEFVNGIAVNGNGFRATTKKNISGTFRIEEREDGWVACKDILDLVKVPVANKEQLVFTTKAGGGNDGYTNQNMIKVLKDILQEGTLVTLVPFSDKQFGIHDAIVVDGKIVGHFRCSQRKGGDATITSLYRFKQGRVSHVLHSYQGEKLGDIAMVVLDDVKDVECPDGLVDTTGRLVEHEMVTVIPQGSRLSRMKPRKLVTGVEGDDPVWDAL